MIDLFNSKGAEFSPCRVYRYSLWRVWDKNKPYALFIGLNHVEHSKPTALDMTAYIITTV